MNVYEAAKERIAYIFEHFDNIILSFSGGKDSGVMLNLCIDYMRENNVTKKIALFHIDYEAQYQMTTDYVDLEYSKNSDLLEYYRICMPVKAQCATSVNTHYWLPWNKGEKDIWVRDMPLEAVNEDNHSFDFWYKGMWDYEFQKKISEWYQKEKGGGRTAVLVGIRTQESLNRWRAIYSDRNTNTYNGKDWTCKMYDDVYNCYPIFDWLTDDVWTANAKFGWEYNKLYDLFYMAGVGVEQMRVASPFNDSAQESLKLYKVIDPNNWAKFIGRVDGVNFTGIYGGTTAMGWKSIQLPKGHTWESYMYFLLSTLPEKTKEGYLTKLETSMKFWQERGGVLSQEVIGKLKKAGIKMEVGEETNYKTDKKPVRMTYQDDIDIKEFREIPTFKRMCICIMKNDHLCKYMGFSQTKNEMQRRKDIIKKYENIL